MNVNFFVEDMLFFKYIGCATAAKTLYKALLHDMSVDVSYNAMSNTFDVVHYHTFGPLALSNEKMNRGCSVLTAHSTPRINEDNVAFHNVINSLYPKIYRSFDHIITISEICQQEIAAMVPGVPTTLIPNGVDREMFSHDGKKAKEFREAHGIDDDAPVVLTVAQQTPRKGIYDVMELSMRFPDLLWVWVGGFPYGMGSKDYFKIQQMKKKCGENMLFTGFVPDIVSAYSAADIFFMPSYAETFGLVNLEALSCGLPVVARDIPEFREIFGENLAYFGNVDEAARQIADDGALRALAAAARAFTGRFDIRCIAEQHRALYCELVES
ncbi:MAG: glycosyltransferase family 4 protein [Methanomicrobiaceae archaeon]|nr:glycosyltransferase family 4 protein [Methanomicrobiaceae archaeon]